MTRAERLEAIRSWCEREGQKGYLDPDGPGPKNQQRMAFLLEEIERLERLCEEQRQRLQIADAVAGELLGLEWET